MDDRTVEVISRNCDHTDQGRNSDPFVESVVQTNDADDCETELSQETTCSLNEDSGSSTKQETPSAQEPTLPILRKIINLSKQVQDLKKEHEVLSNQAKTVNSDVFLGPEVFEPLQLLGKEHEVLKKKYKDESAECRRLYNEVIDLKGIENGPARKHTDLTEIFNYKQMAEKLQHKEKETKKLQDDDQSLQLRLFARESKCRNLQEKVRELESQLAGERQTRLKQETRAFSAPSSQSLLPSYKPPADRTNLERNPKPPLGPTKLRLPLRRITNIVPPPSPLRTKKQQQQHQHRNSTASFSHSTFHGKENSVARERKSLLMQPKRMSIAARPSIATATTSSLLQPRRRVSIATWGPESSLATPLHTSARLKSSGQQPLMKDLRKARYPRLFTPMRSESEIVYSNEKSLLTQPKRMSIAVRPSIATTSSLLQPRRRVSIATWRLESSLATPLHTSARLKSSGQHHQQQLSMKDLRKARYSRLNTPMRYSESEMTPAVIRSSSKFMGSPITQVGSSKLGYLTGLALPRKTLVWSPLRLKGARKMSLIPQRQ